MKTTFSLSSQQVESKHRRPAAVQKMPAVRRARPSGRPDPVPEQKPWLTPEDAAGWHTVYRGTGKRSQITSSISVSLTSEQDEWLDGAAAVAGLTVPGFIGKLIEDARRADSVSRASPAEQQTADAATRAAE